MPKSVMSKQCTAPKKCEMETIENVAESVFHDLSQDNCAFAALKL